MRTSTIILSLFAIAFFNTTFAAEGALKPERLRCEYKTEPLGIDDQEPRLSWIVTSPERGQKQTGCRILVASSSEALKKDQGDLWDTGKVASNETIGTAYQGKSLVSGQRCWWKIQVWDKDGKPSAWSEPASWSMGLLAAADWKADWIGFDAERTVDQADAPLDGAKWIAHGDDKPLNGPKGFRLFVGRPKLPADVKVEKAELFAIADDKLWLVFNGHTLTAAQVGWKVAKKFDVTKQIKPGENDFRIQVENDSEGPTGVCVKLIVTTTDGKTINISTDDTWKGTNNPGANWHIRELDTSKWPGVKVLGEYGMAPWGKAKNTLHVLPPAAYLRTTFETPKDKKIARATVYAAALGLFDLHLNGERVSDDYFHSGWTDYTKRVYYRTFDVTKFVKAASGNCLGAILADGWYSGYVGFGKNRNHYGEKPRFRAQLHLEYEDGTTQIVTTNPTWKARTGMIREADFLMGETCDWSEKYNIACWDRFGCLETDWKPVVTGAEVKPLMQAHPAPAVRPFAELKPKKITQPKPGEFVLDMGQNFAGVVRLNVPHQAKGQKITLRFAERLNPDGTIYTTNLRDARCVDTYICRGDDKGESWQPRFTFHGFQYVEVTGLSEVTADNITGIALSSDTPIAGSFHCSDPMLNQLHSNIVWTQRMNFIDIPTDCPQRDERLGWTGDAQVYVRTATLNADVQSFFGKWLVDLNDGQRADGQFPMVAPVKVAGDDGGPAWADAGVICPWTMYEVYGDKRILEKSYPAMQKFIDFCVKRSTPDLLPPKEYHCFGDWLSIKSDTPKDVIYMAYLAKSLRLTAQTAKVLGKVEDEKKYGELFNKAKAAFNKAYVSADGRIKGDTQTCYVLAIAFDLLDPENLKLAAKYLVADIEAKANHLSTGFIGTKDLMLALSKIGRSDVAYRLLHNESFPSWGFSIKHGATSIWERWDGWTPDKGFQDAGMNSFAHYSFGAVHQWMVENIGGIQSAEPSYSMLAIQPMLDGKMTSAKVRYDSIRGPIESNWTYDEKTGKLTLDVTIPANANAWIGFPNAQDSPVTESGQPVEKVPGITLEQSPALIVKVGSGTYHFSSTWHPDKGK